MVLYEKSVIYKLKRNDDYDDTNIYIGSTSNFKNRKYQHKECCNNPKSSHYNHIIYEFIRDNGNWDNWVMIAIEEYPCNSKKELEIRERFHIDRLKSKLNSYIPGRTKKEYRENNREEATQRTKQWRLDNYDRYS